MTRAGPNSIATSKSSRRRWPAAYCIERSFAGRPPPLDYILETGTDSCRPARARARAQRAIT